MGSGERKVAGTSSLVLLVAHAPANIKTTLSTFLTRYTAPWAVLHWMESGASKVGYTSGLVSFLAYGTA